MIPIAGIVLATLATLGAVPSPGARDYHARLGSHAGLTLPGVAGRLDLMPYCDCAGVTKIRTWFDSRTVGRRYLLLELSSDSNPDRPDGQCGAGEETMLVWLAVQPPYRVVDSQAFLSESCRQTVERSSAPASATAPLEWRFVATANDGVERDYLVTFDRLAPERGLRAHYTFSPW
jgi:hypothetical protein